MLDPQLLGLLDELRFRLRLGIRDALTGPAEPRTLSRHARIVPGQARSGALKPCPNLLFEGLDVCFAARANRPGVCGELAAPFVPCGHILAETIGDLTHCCLSDFQELACRGVPQGINDLRLTALERQGLAPRRVRQVDLDMLLRYRNRGRRSLDRGRRKRGGRDSARACLLFGGMRRVQHRRPGKIAIVEGGLLDDVGQLVKKDCVSLSSRGIDRAVSRDNVPAQGKSPRADRQGRRARLRAAVHANIPEVMPEALFGHAARLGLERLAGHAHQRIGDSIVLMLKY